VTVVQQYLPHILRSFGYALAATVFALLFSYPLAYFIGVKAAGGPPAEPHARARDRPFFISFLLRTLAWKQLLSDESFIITSLKALSLMAPDAHFTGRRSR
jgi:spermidine/putrescine transport system permease protein